MVLPKDIRDGEYVVFFIISNISSQRNIVLTKPLRLLFLGIRAAVQGERDGGSGRPYH